MSAPGRGVELDLGDPGCATDDSIDQPAAGRASQAFDEQRYATDLASVRDELIRDFLALVRRPGIFLHGALIRTRGRRLSEAIKIVEPSQIGRASCREKMESA